MIYPSLNSLELLKQIKHHLFNHVVQLPSQPQVIGRSRAVGSDVRDGGKQNCKAKNTTSSGVYTQIKGIPQGSVLSPLLCKLYYDFVENQVFGNKDEVIGGI